MADMNITSSGTYKIEKNFTGTITIATSSAVTLDGTNASNLSNVKIVASSNVADLMIKNLNATNESGNVIKFGSGTGNKLTLIGTNKLKAPGLYSAVVHVGGGLTIDGTGSLDVTAGREGAGIGSNAYEKSKSNILIRGGKITASGFLGAGIGSGSGGSIGNITINTVSVNATGWGNGIGAGLSGSAGKVTSTIGGDASDDILIGTSKTDTFSYAGGNDVITNYSHEDIVHIKSVKIDSYSFDGSDLIFKIGSGSLRLNNMTNHAITVKDSSGNTTTKVYGTGYSGHEVMKRFVHSMVNSKLDTKLKVDEAIRACSHFNSLQEVIDQLLSDLNKTGDAETFLKKYCGIFKENTDTGAVTGWDAGGLHAKTTNELLPTNYSNSYPTSTSFTKRGLTLTIPAKNTLTPDEQFVVQKIYSADMEDSLKLIEDTYGFKFTDKPLSIPLNFVYKPGDSAVAWGGIVGITINLSNGGGNDPAYYLTHELTHVAQQYFGFFDYMPNFMFEGMADLTAGGDIRGALDLASDPSKLAQYLTSSGDPYTTGVIFWRYLMRQAADSYDSSKSYTWKDNSSIKGTVNAEFLTGSGKNMTLSAGAGNDTLTVYGENMKVLGDGGNDYILIGSLASGTSIDGGEDNDTVRNEGMNVTILGGLGKDSIENEGANITIDGDSDDDQIKSHSDNVNIMGGEGNDTLLVEKTSNYNWDKSIWEDTYHEKATIDGGVGSDSIKNENANASINGGNDNDTVENHGDKVTINGGAGKDLLINGEYFGRGGVKLSINGGADDDTITNSGSNSLLDGGVGNDLIHNGYYYYRDWNAYYEASYSNEHDDSLKSSSVTITGGRGNDTIKNHGKNVLFQYASGDGDDYIEGFNATSTLNISGGTYTKEKSGSDVIVTVGNGKITLQGAASLSNLNILGKKISTSAWSLNGTTATYGDSITVTGIKSLDGVSLNNKTVTISNTALNQGMVTVSDGYILALADDVSKPSTSAATWTNKNGTYTYTAKKTSAGYSLSGNKISYTPASGGDKFTITGLKSSANPTKSNTGIKVDSKGVVTISTSALNGKAVTLTGAGYTLAVDSSVRTKATTTKAAWTKKNSTFTYTAPITSDFYTIKGNTLNYTAKKGGDKFTITGLKNTNAVTVSGKKVTIGNASLDGKAVTLTGDYTLALAKDVTTSTKKTTGAFTTVSKGTATYKTTSFSGYYKVSGKKISYTASSGSQSITIKNLNTATKLSALKSGVTVAEQSNGSYKITFKNSAVLTTKAPTISATKGLKYTVAVADSLKPVTKSAWTVSGTNATFRSNTTAGYTVNSKNAVVYTAQKNGSPLIELTGMVKGVKASSIAAPKNKIVTLNANVLGKNASLKSNGGGYTINLSGNMSGKKFTGTGKVDTFTVAANNANVDLGAGNDVVTVSGLKVTLNGGNGNDKLTGSKNVDLIYGGAGNDSILGNAANDKLYGDAGNDSLRGGAGNDTLTGGKGNDSLWSDAGNDTFLYSNGDGKDVIYGFENNDLLQITGVFSASYNKSKKEIAFKVGSTANAITLKDFTATSFHINGDTYGISGTKLVKK